MLLPRTKEWREARGLHQRDLAAAAGVGESTIPRVERGDSVRPATARKLAAALGVSVSDLLESPPVPLAPAPPASPPVPLAPAPPASPSPDDAGAGQRGAELLEDPRVGEWLRARGVELGTMTDEEFADYARSLDTDAKDEDGRPLAVMELGRALTEEADRARDILWTQRTYRPLVTLLPADPDATPEEKHRQRREHLAELRAALRRRYGRRAAALKRYAELWADPAAALWVLAYANAEAA